MTKKALIIVILIGVLLRVGLLCFSTDLDFSTDAPTYQAMAQNIDSHPSQLAYYPPLYTMLLGSLYRIFGHNMFIFNVLGLILYAIASIAVFKLTAILFNRTAGVFAAAFFSIEPVSVFYSSVTMPETLAVIFLCFSVYFLVKFFKSNPTDKKQYGFLVASVVLLALGMLTKTILFYFPVVVALLVVIYFRKSPKKILTVMLITIILLCVLISPWVIRNYLVHGRFCFAKTLDFFSPTKNSFILHINNTVLRRIKECPLYIRDQALRYFFGTNAILLYRACFRAEGLFIEHTSKALNIEEYRVNKYYAGRNKGLPSNIYDYKRLLKYSRGFAVFSLALTAILLIIYVFAACGALFALKEGRINELLLVVIVNMYFAAIIIIALCGSRYRFGAIGFYSALAGFGASRVYRQTDKLFRRLPFTRRNDLV